MAWPHCTSVVHWRPSTSCLGCDAEATSVLEATPREGQAWLGYEWLRTTSNQWTLVFTSPGGQQMTVRNGVASWAQQRSSRSRLWRRRRSGHGGITSTMRQFFQRHILSKWRASLFGHVAHATQMLLHNKPCGCRRTCPLVGSPTSDRDATWSTTKDLVHARSGMTSECLLVTTGTAVSTVATVEWRNGPQGLRGNDDNYYYVKSTHYYTMYSHLLFFISEKEISTKKNFFHFIGPTNTLEVCCDKAVQSLHQV